MANHRRLLSSLLTRNGLGTSYPSRQTTSGLRTEKAFATTANTSSGGLAAPEIDFDAQAPPDATRARIVPASPSYFSSQPGFTDNLVRLQTLLRNYEHLPTVPRSTITRLSWKTLMEYRAQVGETVLTSRYERIKSILNRLRLIHPQLQPKEVRDAIQKHRRPLDPFEARRRPQVVDEFGRAYANGRRKSSRANVYLVEGNGQVLINDRSISHYFGRVHDRESALWPLSVTERLNKYNVWATVHGGGTTGQAESLTLGIAKALLVHEPALKPALRRAGCVTRDPRRVERKKPGHVKARKMPAWVKR